MKKIINNLYIYFIWLLLLMPLLGLLMDIDFNSINIINNNEILKVMSCSLIVCIVSSFLIILISYFLSIYYYKNNLKINNFLIIIVPCIMISFMKILLIKNNLILLILSYILMYVGIVTKVFIKYLDKSNNYILILKKPMLITFLLLNLIILNEGVVNILLFNNDILLSSYMYSAIRFGNINNFYSALILELIIIIVIMLICYMCMYENKLRSKDEKD